MDKMRFWKKDEFSSDFGKPADPAPAYDLGAGHFDSSVPDPMQHQDFNPESFPQQFSQQSYPQTSNSFPGSLQRQQPQQVPEQQYAEPTVNHRDIELILAKLDAIKSDLDALHQRVRKIEQATETQPQQKRYW